MRPFLSSVLIFLACFLSLAAVAALWADQELLNESRFVETTSSALSTPAVSNALAGEATDQLYQRVDIAALLDGALPEQIQPLAPLAAASLRSPIEKGLAEALSAQPIQKLEKAAITESYQTTLAALQGKPGLIVAEGDAFKIDLRLVVVTAASKIGLGDQARSLLAPGSLKIQLVQSSYISQARTFVHWLPIASFWLPALVLLLAIVGVASARRRYWALIGLGGGWIIASLSLLLAGSQVTNQIGVGLDGFYQAFASEIWLYWLGDLRSLCLALGTIGLLTITAGLLASPWLLPVREQASLAINRGPWLVFLAVLLAVSLAAILSGLSLWPVVLAVAGLCAWRYQMEGEGLPKDTSKFDQFFGLAASPEPAAPKPAAKKPASKPAAKKPASKPAAKKPASKPRSDRTT